MTTSATPPDLEARPARLEVERRMRASAHALYRAWTEEMDRWFAAPGSAAMQARVGAPFYFEVHQPLDTPGMVRRHPHYGRFIRLEPDRLVQLTWVTGGTAGAETLLTVELVPLDEGTLLRLTHAGFATEQARDAHAQAWPLVLDQLDASVFPER